MFSVIFHKRLTFFPVKFIYKEFSLFKEVPIQRALIIQGNTELVNTRPLLFKGIHGFV